MLPKVGHGWTNIQYPTLNQAPEPGGPLAGAPDELARFPGLSARSAWAYKEPTGGADFVGDRPVPLVGNAPSGPSTFEVEIRSPGIVLLAPLARTR